MKKLLPIFLILIGSFLSLPSTTFASWDGIYGAEVNSNTDGVEITTNSAPFAVSTNQAHSGARSWRVNAGAGFGRQVLFTANQTSTSTARVWVYVVARPNATTQFLRFSNAANATQGHIVMLTTGALQLQKANNVVIGSNSSVIPLNTWTYVELRDEPTTGATGTLTAQLNGVQFASGLNSAAGSWARVLFGNITGAQTTNDMYFDDIAVTDTLTGYPGGSSTVFMQPNAAGDANSWLNTTGGAGASTNYTLVNEAPPDDATSMVQSALLNSEDLYNFTDSGLHSYDTINALVLKPRFTNDVADATDAFKIEWEASSGGTKAQTSAIIPNSTSWSSDFFFFSTTTDTGGAALTSSTIDSMQAGYIESAVGLNKIQITNIWGYIDYVAGVAPAANSPTFIEVSDE